ncbi:VOC family protein [Nocardioides panacisoli]|uniref:VOC family protein n=1 Tax=Nocardioides panacisoli TaxID=627624 RepID=UPI001C62D489|nr:VOC family protein [Nocardioides panacisoli]QYJ03537.1 VOC family protein [Nocardioides panacisoli]
MDTVGPAASSRDSSEQQEPRSGSMARLADLHHIGIVVAREHHHAVVTTLMHTLGGVLEFEVDDDPLDVTATWVHVSAALRFEVVSPRSDQETAITRFLDRTGGGLHHVSLGTEQIGSCKELVADAGATIIGENDDHGGWAEFFIDPRETGGALLHWMQELDRS